MAEAEQRDQARGCDAQVAQRDSQQARVGLEQTVRAMMQHLEASHSGNSQCGL